MEGFPISTARRRGGGGGGGRGAGHVGDDVDFILLFQDFPI